MYKKVIIAALITNCVLYASNLTQKVEYKGETLTLPVSLEQINRIVLPSKITSKVVSKEKNLEVSISENQAFIKFSPIIETTKMVEQGKDPQQAKAAVPVKQEVKYAAQTPTEIYFLTEDNNTYSFILVPSTMDAQTILLNNPNQKRKDLTFKEKQTPFVNLVSDITKKAFLNKELHGYESQDVNERLASNNNVDITLKKRFLGAKFDVFKLEITNMTNKEVVIEERSLIGLVDRPTYAVSIYYDNELYEIGPRSKAFAVLIVAAANAPEEK